MSKVSEILTSPDSEECLRKAMEKSLAGYAGQ
jgi:hypothetical protein